MTLSIWSQDNTSEDRLDPAGSCHVRGSAVLMSGYQALFAYIDFDLMTELISLCYCVLFWDRISVLCRAWLFWSSHVGRLSGPPLTELHSAFWSAVIKGVHTHTTQLELSLFSVLAFETIFKLIWKEFDFLKLLGFGLSQTLRLTRSPLGLGHPLGNCELKQLWWRAGC